MSLVIHRYASVDGAYHAIQTNPWVHDGHIVALPALHEVAVLCGAHLQAVDPASRLFPAFTDSAVWRQFADGRYDDAARLARCVLAGWITDPVDEPTVTGAGTFRAIYDRIYGFGMPGFQAQAIAALACEMYGADLISALNNIMVAKNEWFYGKHGHEVDRFYASQPVQLPHRPRRAG